MVEIKKLLLYLLLVICLWSSSIIVTASLDAEENKNSLAHHLNTVQGSLEVLSRSIRSAQSDLIQRQLEECQIMGSSSDPICSLFNLDRTLGNDDHLSDVLQRPFATDKRGDSNLEETDRRKRLLDDLYRKEKMLERLKSVIEEAQGHMQEERKRSCNLNLGYHCKTEQYSQIADMYNWLQSSLSPGRRKRSTRTKRIASKSQCVHRVMKPVGEAKIP